MSPIHHKEYSFGRYTNGRLMAEFYDNKKPPTGMKMVQLCHGWPGGPAQFMAMYNMLSLLYDNGYLPFATDQSGTNLFGGTGVYQDIEAANAFMVGKYQCRADKFALIGYSMGFINASQEKYQNPGKIPVMLGVAPATDGTGIYNQAAPGSQIRIDMDATPGGTGTWASVDAARSPIKKVSSFANTHIAIWQGTADTTVLPAQSQAFATATGAVYRTNAGDHGSVWIFVNEADVLTELQAGDWS